MRTILALMALAWLALPGFGATNQATIQMLATTDGVVKTPTNLTSVKFQGVTITNLTGFGLVVSNAQLSVDTTQLPAGGGGGGGSGTVTSVGLTMPSSIFDVASSPVTTSGTIGVTFDNQAANTVFAGPTTGSAAAPTMRSLVDADIPSAIARDSEVAAGYQPLDATLTAVSGASTGADVLVYFSAVDTAAVTTFTAFGRSIADDADNTAARVTLGLVIGTNVQAWDADLDDLADGSLSGSKVGSGIDAGNITTGTLADARIDSAIARDAEMAALYQPLDADLTALAAISTSGIVARTGSGAFATRTITGDSEITVSNGDGVSGNPTLAIASSITRDSELSAYAPLAGPTFTGDPKAPTPAASDNDTSIATTAYVQGEIASIGSGSDQWDEWDSWSIKRWEFGGNSSALGLEPGLAFTAISSGTGGTTVGISAFDGHNGYYIRTATGAATSTGGWVNDGVNTRYFTARANQLKFEFSANRTNGAVYGFGYSDSTTTTEATDALRLIMTNDVICGLALSNSIKAVTASTFQIQQGIEYRGFILQTNDYARFQVYSNVPESSAVLVWEDTIGTGIPLGSSRALGISFGGFNTHVSVTNGTDFLYINRAIERTAQ